MLAVYGTLTVATKKDNLSGQAENLKSEENFSWIPRV